MTAAAPVDLALTPDVTLRVEGCTELAARLAQAWTVRPAAGGGRPVCALRVASDGHAPTSPTSQLIGRSTTDGFWLDAADFRAGCTMRCLPGLTPRTLLPWLNALLLDVGVLPLHASAFACRGVGVAVTGAAHSGKTGALLAAVDRGATPLGDECVWHAADGTLHAITLPIEVRLDYVRELPRYRPLLPGDAVRRARACEVVAGATAGALPSLSRKFARRARVAADGRRLVGEYATGHRLDHLFVSVRHPDPEVVVRPIPPAEARALVVDIQLAEFEPMLTAYRQGAARSQQPRSELLERLGEIMTDRIETMLSTVEVRLLAHPYPVEAGRLVDAIEAAL